MDVQGILWTAWGPVSEGTLREDPWMSKFLGRQAHVDRLQNSLIVAVQTTFSTDRY